MILINLSRSPFPLMMEILSLGTLYCFERNLMSSVLAFPFSAGAAMRIFKVPSSMVSISSDFGLLGMTLMRR